MAEKFWLPARVRGFGDFVGKIKHALYVHPNRVPGAIVCELRVSFFATVSRHRRHTRAGRLETLQVVKFAPVKVRTCSSPAMLLANSWNYQPFRAGNLSARFIGWGV